MQATLVEMDGEDDHVHLLVEYPPKVSVSSLVNSLKGVSSRLLRQQRLRKEKLVRCNTSRGRYMRVCSQVQRSRGLYLHP